MCYKQLVTHLDSHVTYVYIEIDIDIDYIYIKKIQSLIQNQHVT